MKDAYKIQFSTYIALNTPRHLILHWSSSFITFIFIPSSMKNIYILISMYFSLLRLSLRSALDARQGRADDRAAITDQRGSR